MGFGPQIIILYVLLWEWKTVKKNLLHQILEPLDYCINLWAFFIWIFIGNFYIIGFDSILFLTWNAAKEMYSSIMQGYEKWNFSNFCERLGAF